MAAVAAQDQADVAVKARLPPPPPRLEDKDVVLSGEFNHVDLSFEDFVKNDLRVRVDTDSQLCRAYIDGHCPLGSKCPLRHVQPSVLNFRAPSPSSSSAHARTVCKHWLRGLCKKGAACEFLHEYNLRKMPECWFFAKYAYCSSGDECMYLHIGPEERRGECRGYARGFCPLGPNCPHRHIRRILCPMYLTGFCPLGPDCPNAHPPFDLGDVERYIKQESNRDKDLYRNRDRDWPEEEGGGRPGADAGGGTTRFGKKDMTQILCFKCGQRGHFANACPNPSVPGMRGGVERGPGGRVLA